MRSLLVALALLALPTVASAAPKYSDVQLCEILQPCEPPPEYASGPFVAPPAIRPVSLAEVQKDCGGGYRAFLGDRAASAPGIMGCAIFASGSCIVYVPSDVKASVPELYDVVLRHELAHCRGWVHQDYSAGRF